MNYKTATFDIGLRLEQLGETTGGSGLQPFLGKKCQLLWQRHGYHPSLGKNVSFLGSDMAKMQENLRLNCIKNVTCINCCVATSYSFNKRRIVFQLHFPPPPPHSRSSEKLYPCKY